jgi:hypothetical protein
MSSAEVHHMLADLGVRPDARIDDFVEQAGEPALVGLLLRLEEQMPEPRPLGLLEQVETLGELIGFAAVKSSRRLPPR